MAASEAFIEETTAESAATAEEIAELQKEIAECVGWFRSRVAEIAARYGSENPNQVAEATSFLAECDGYGIIDTGCKTSVGGVETLDRWEAKLKDDWDLDEETRNFHKVLIQCRRDRESVRAVS